MVEARFLREMDVFNTEVLGASQLIYAYLAVNAAMTDRKEVTDHVNRAPLFWSTCLYGLQSSGFMALGRVFDQDRKSKHNLDVLIGIAQSNLEIFSKAALARRRQVGLSERPPWLDDYLRTVYVPTPHDFRRLRKHIAKWRRVYNDKYRPIRHQLYAHRGAFGEESAALWAKTQVGELQRLLKFLRQLYEALWELFHNGSKPVLQPQRHSLKNMRDRPSESGRLHAVPERIAFEAESYLLRGCGLPPPKKPKRKKGDIFDLYDK